MKSRRKPASPSQISPLAPPRTKRRLSPVLLAAPLLWPLGLRIATYRRDLQVATQALPPAPQLQPSDRLLIVAPHPDDEVLGLGGTVAAARALGAAVHIAFMTNGDGSGSTQLAEGMKQHRRVDFQQIAAMRQREATLAAAGMGVGAGELSFLGYPDGGSWAMWHEHWNPETPFESGFTHASAVPYSNAPSQGAPYLGSQLTTDLERLISEFRPTHLFVTDSADTHLDHVAAYGATRAALEHLRLGVETRSWAQDIQLYTYLIHYHIWPVPHGYHPRARLVPPDALQQIEAHGTRWHDVALGAPSQAAKRHALERYVSQMMWTPHYLRGFVRKNELWGQEEVVSASGDQWITLLRHATGETATRRAAAGASINEIEVRRTSQGVGLRLKTANTPLNDGLFSVHGHSISDSEIKAWRIVRDNYGAKLQRFNDGFSTAVEIVSTDEGLEFEVPLEAIGLAESGTLLLMASTGWKGRAIDRTPIGVWRL